MRRWLTVFLLFLLPLQLSWAVAATYCAHEAEPAASHVGHHAHRHEASIEASIDASPAGKIDAAGHAEKAGKAADKAASCVDDDCGFCHLGHSQPVASTPIVLPSVAGPLVEASVPDVWSSRGPDRRERPNWHAA